MGGIIERVRERERTKEEREKKKQVKMTSGWKGK